MESNNNKMLMMIMLVVVVVSVSNGQSICQVPMSGLMACRAAVTPARPAPPAAACCAALAHADFNCLCSYKNSNLLPSLGIDPDLAFQLPNKCNLSQSVNCP